MKQILDQYIQRRGRNECWPWVGPVLKGKNGRGYLTNPITGKTENAARMVFRAYVAAVPTGIFVCHSCDNPNCVNPLHLWLGTHQDNMRDSAAKKRHHIQRCPEKMPRCPADKLARGIRHGSAKLTNEQIRKIRESYIPQRGVREQLARQYGVNPTTIGRIVRGEIWKHIPMLGGQDD